MIPKVIHYCWFGGKKIPKQGKRCMNSWKKFCPDYEIREWNENNFDLSSAPQYVQEAYREKRYAFVSDYVRLYAVYQCGGLYLDTDVELLKPFDDLLNQRAYFGFCSTGFIGTGLGFGAEQGHPILEALMDQYQSIPFVLEDGQPDLTPCPQRNESIFLRYGFKKKNEEQMIQEGVHIYPIEFFDPLDYHTKEIHITKSTHSIH